MALRPAVAGAARPGVFFFFVRDGCAEGRDFARAHVAALTVFAWDIASHTKASRGKDFLLTMVTKDEPMEN